MDDLIIGTRESELAVYQAERVADIILWSDVEVDTEIRKIKTKGDKILDKPLSEIGGKGVFLKEIEKYLIEGEIDLAVHSLKDVPTELPEGLNIGAFLDAEDPRDCLVSIDHQKISDLPSGSRIGTGSLRRKCQLLRKRPDLEVVPVRGNVKTRLEKLENEDYDALVLAAAGLKRLDLEDKISQYFSPHDFLPAPGQGVLAVEIKEDPELKDLLMELEEAELRDKMTAERTLLEKLGGDCHVPVGCRTELVNDHLVLTALVGSPDGLEYIELREKGELDRPSELGEITAERLLDAGADRFLEG
ncbi:MAG: hydroxymethylbilane synthase [Thermoplasmata archaeon]